MTSRLMARLFVVPLLIVAMVVGSSVLVVLLFGWITTSQQESVEHLVARIEAGSGDKVFGVALLPKDKEVWQAAMELAQRLEPGHPKTVPDEQKPGVAQRLEKVLSLARGASQHDEGQQLQQFLLTALGHLGQSTSISVLSDYATDAKQPLNVRRSAIGAIVLMRRQPFAADTVPAMLSLMDDPEPVVRMSAVVALGAIAPPGDPAAIAGLTRAYRSNNREVAWNAALALAKVGSNAAAPLLQDMLTRTYWERQKVEFPGSQAPGQEERHLTPTQIESYLLLAIDAAAALHDASLQPMVQRLTEDPSLQVRDRSRKALQNWTAASAPVR